MDQTERIKNLKKELAEPLAQAIERAEVRFYQSPVSPAAQYLPAEAFGNHLLKMGDVPEGKVLAAKIPTISIQNVTREQLIKKVKRELRTDS